MLSIKTKREQIGMTQAQFADALGVSRATVAMWESAHNYPRAEMLPNIANIFGCTIDELYADDRKEVG